MLSRQKYFLSTVISAIVLAPFLLSCANERSRSLSTHSGIRVNSPKLLLSREILAFYGVALNYNPGGNAALITEFTNLYPTLPQNGDSAYSSSMSRMFTNFAFRFCSGSMAIEQQLPADRRLVFKYVNLTTAPGAFLNTDMEARMGAYIKFMAHRFYGMSIPDDEFEVIDTFYKAQRSLVTQDAAGARDLAVQVCALLGSTPRAIAKR